MLYIGFREQRTIGRESLYILAYLVELDTAVLAIAGLQFRDIVKYRGLSITVNIENDLVQTSAFPHYI